MHTPKYSFSFSFGNVATIVCGVVFALSIAASLQIAVASANQERKDMKSRIEKNEIAIQQVVALREDIIRISVNQKNQSKQFDIIVGILKENRRRERP
ncbi:MAG: hypothetical protein V3U75_13560 [Methylococcaceae bacterium]